MSATHGAPTHGAGTSPETHELAWFCLRSQLKHEHIAAANLRRLEGVEVFNPRIRFKRSTRRGPVWFVESLFPSYVFARFDWRTSLRLVHHSPGVAGVVHFGSRWPTVPDHVIANLKTSVGEEELKVMPDTVQPGDAVQIFGGQLPRAAGIGHTSDPGAGSRGGAPRVSWSPDLRRGGDGRPGASGRRPLPPGKDGLS